MPVITAIIEQKRRPNRRSIFLNGQFAFGCKLNVVARFRLREGLSLSTEQIRQIEEGEIRQECFDHAMRFLERRLHSRVELARKLAREQYGTTLVDEVLDQLAHLGYVNDERFARAKALSSAQRKHHGRRRAQAELLKAGVSNSVAALALESIYGATDTLASARQLAAKQAVRLRRLDPLIARRRLAGMLQRRGFDYEEIKPVIDEILQDVDTGE